MIANISPKGESFSDFIRTFAISFSFLLVCNCSTKMGKISDMIEILGDFLVIQVFMKNIKL